MHHAQRVASLSLSAILGCGSVNSPMPDAPPASAICDPLGAFDPPKVLVEIDPSHHPADLSLSADELTLYLTQTAPAGDRDLYVASRSRVTDPFGAPIPLASVNSASEEGDATLSVDGFTLMFQSKRVTGEGEHLYVATRTSQIANFSAPALVASVGSPVTTDDDGQPFLTADGQELWFISSRTGGRDIYRATKTGSGFANPVVVPGLSSLSSDQHYVVSADRLTVYFASARVAPGASGSYDVYRAHRSTVGDGFGMPALATELNTAEEDAPGWLSADNCRLYMHANVGGMSKPLMASRRPPS
jgi:hypothetical protein